MNQHTPGPWAADKNWLGPDTYGDGNSIPVFPHGGGVAICDVVTVTGEGLSRPDVQAKGEANARLIASAPELLSALRDLADYVFRLESKENICSSVWMEARAAIAKAEGRAQ